MKAYIVWWENINSLEFAYLYNMLYFWLHTAVGSRILCGPWRLAKCWL